MVISKDLIYYKNNDGSWIIYNSEFNKYVRVNNAIYREIMNYKKMKSDGISDVTVNFPSAVNDILIKNHIIIDKKERINSFYLKYESLFDNVDVESVYFHLTQRCNLNCEYCYVKEYKNKPDLLSLEEIKLIIDKLNKQHVKYIILTGGEPTMRQDILDIIDYIKNKDMKITLLTNGTRITNEILDKVDTAIVSIDHSDISFISGKVISKRDGFKFKAFSENLDGIFEKNRKKIIVRSVVIKGNEHKIDMMRDYIENELDLRYTIIGELPNSSMDLINSPHFSSLTCNSNSCEFTSSRCGACNKVLAIDSDGAIYPCQNLLLSEFKIGSMLDDDWYESVLNTNLRRTFSEVNVNTIDGCKSCELKYLCGSGCRALAYKIYGSLDAKLDFMCDFLYNQSETVLRNIGNNINSFKKGG